MAGWTHSLLQRRRPLGMTSIAHSSLTQGICHYTHSAYSSFIERKLLSCSLRSLWGSKSSPSSGTPLIQPLYPLPDTVSSFVKSENRTYLLELLGVAAPFAHSSVPHSPTPGMSHRKLLNVDYLKLLTAWLYSFVFSFHFIPDESQNIFSLFLILIPGLGHQILCIWNAI